MKKLANVLVKYRLLFFIVSIVMAIFCACLIPKVTINKDQSKYLAKDSNMSQGLEIINKEFPKIELKDSFQIMFEGLTPSQKEAVHKELAEFEGVTDVDFDLNSVEHNSKTYCMYIVHTDYAGDNDKVNDIIKKIQNRYEDTYKVYTYYSGSQLDVLDRLIPMALIVGTIILFLMCKSFFEPVLLLVSIGIAILINMGSNVIFESVSDMTFSIAAIFQLVLSIDYSIMLLHRYQQEYELLGRQNKPKAMRNAIMNAFGSVSSSSITTIVSLLVLLMMSFTIGKDIGLVISKGVFFSVVCVFTVMPSLIIWFGDLVYKLDKNNLKAKLLQKKAALAVAGEAVEVTEAADVIEAAEVAEAIEAEEAIEAAEVEEVVEATEGEAVSEEATEAAEATEAEKAEVVEEAEETTVTEEVTEAKEAVEVGGGENV